MKQKEQLLKAISKVDIFDTQPDFTMHDLDRLLKLGAITNETFTTKRGEISNKNPFDVASYTILSKAIQNGKINQTDARRLIMVEAVRSTHGLPRKTHFARLMVAAYAENKAEASKNIEKYMVKAFREWNQKAQSKGK